MTPYTYYEYYAWYMKPDGGFDSNNRVGYLSYGKQSPYTLNANAAWHVDPGGNVTVDFDFVSLHAIEKIKPSFYLILIKCKGFYTNVRRNE